MIPKAVTVICVGNICRSPVGEYLLRNYAKSYNYPEIQEIQFDSAGLHGGMIDISQFSKEYLLERGIDPVNFQSKATTQEYFEKFDLILILEDYMKDFILDTYFFDSSIIKRFKLKRKIKTLLEQSGSAGDIEDPYMMDRKTYYSILEQIDEACKRIIQKWIS